MEEPRALVRHYSYAKHHSQHPMFSDLERCERCHQRYPEPLGHRCPQASFAEQRERDFEQQFTDWLETPEGRFAAYLAHRQRPV